tara:strand:- start:273 stop:725 length:453 start_codon:yes stop_codon:yes gene_type:complete
MPARKKKDIQPNTPKDQVFYTKKMNAITIRNKDYVFYKGKLEVPHEIGELIRQTSHYANGSLLASEESILVNDQLEAKANYEELVSLMKDAKGDHVFRVNIRPHLTIPVRGENVIFNNHYAVVSEEQAEVLRTHPFLNQGKITEVTVELR